MKLSYIYLFLATALSTSFLVSAETNVKKHGPSYSIEAKGCTTPARGPAGPTGPGGPDGQAGPAGTAGPPGTGISLISGRVQIPVNAGDYGPTGADTVSLVLGTPKYGNVGPFVLSPVSGGTQIEVPEDGVYLVEYFISVSLSSQNAFSSFPLSSVPNFRVTMNGPINGANTSEPIVLTAPLFPILTNNDPATNFWQGTLTSSYVGILKKNTPVTFSVSISTDLDVSPGQFQFTAHLGQISITQIH